MGIRSRISKIYKKVDSKVGGKLPGGISSKTSSSTPSPQYTPLPPPPKQYTPMPSSKPATGFTSINPVTGKGQYNLSGGGSVPITPQTTDAIRGGASEQEVVLSARTTNPTISTAPKISVAEQVVAFPERVIKDLYEDFSSSGSTNRRAEELRKGKYLPYQTRGTDIPGGKGAIAYTYEELGGRIGDPAAAIVANEIINTEIRSKVGKDLEEVNRKVEEFREREIKDYLAEQAKLYAKIQRDVEIGKISPDEANRKLREFQERNMERIDSVVKGYYEKQIKYNVEPKQKEYISEAEERIKKVELKKEIEKTILFDIPLAYATGGLFQAAAPRGSTITRNILDASIGSQVAISSYDMAKDKDYVGLIKLGVEGGAFYAGGKTVYNRQLTSQQNKIIKEREIAEQAINKAILREKYIGTNYKGAIGQFEMNAQEAARLKLLVDQGASVRVREVYIDKRSIPSSSRKYVPDVKTKILEIGTIDSGGNFIVGESIGFGEVLVRTPKGTKYDKAIVSKSKQLIEGQTSTGITSVAEGQWTSKGFKKIAETEYLTEAKSVSAREGRVVRSGVKTDLSLVGRTEVEGLISSKDLFGELTFGKNNIKNRARGIKREIKEAGKKAEPLGQGSEVNIDLFRSSKQAYSEELPLGIPSDLGTPYLERGIIGVRESLSKGKGKFSKRTKPENIPLMSREAVPETLIRLQEKIDRLPEQKAKSKSSDGGFFDDLDLASETKPSRKPSETSSLFKDNITQDPLEGIPIMVGGKGGDSLFKTVRGFERDVSPEQANFMAKESQGGSFSLSNSAALKETSRNLLKEGVVRDAEFGLREIELARSNSKFDLSSNFPKGSLLSSDLSLGEGQDIDLNKLEMLKDSSSTSTLSKSNQIELLSQPPRLDQSQGQRNRLKTPEMEIETPTFNIGTPNISVPEIPLTPPPRIILFPSDPDKEEKNRTQYSYEQAYDVYGKKDATKKRGEWIKLNRQPLNKVSAQDLGAFAVDRSISATFEVRPTQGEPKRLEVPEIIGYFEDNSYKFRDYKIEKGQKKKLVDRYIEEAPQRLDTQGEVNQISLAKVKDQITKRVSELKSNAIPSKDTFTLMQPQQIEPPKQKRVVQKIVKRRVIKPSVIKTPSLFNSDLTL